MCAQMFACNWCVPLSFARDNSHYIIIFTCESKCFLNHYAYTKGPHSIKFNQQTFWLLLRIFCLVLYPCEFLMLLACAATRLSIYVETFSFWCSLVQCVLSLVQFTLGVLKYHIQNINFTIMNIMAITVFIHFFPLFSFCVHYMVLRMKCVYVSFTHMLSAHMRQISNQIKEKGRKVHQREKTNEWKTKWIWNVNVCVL